jgi:signal transduction histidine kinase
VSVAVKRHRIERMIAAVRDTLAPPTDPRVAAERSRTLLARATASCWVALAIIPFTLLVYDFAFFPAKVGQGAIAVAAADAAIVLLLLGLRHRLFQGYPWLPFALLAGVVCNATEAVNLVLTGGPVHSGFLFPYHLISFGIAILFPAPILAVIATAALLPLGYCAVAIAANEPLGANQFVSNLMLLVDGACISCIGNKVVTNLFLREVKLRIDLEGANDRLREVDRLKSAFFANVSHELRTPLTLILAPAASLMRDTRGKLEGSQRWLVETITRNANRLLQLINDLLLLAKLEGGVPPVNPVPVDIAAAIRRIAAEAQPFAQSLDLRIELDIGPGSLIWNGDERHFERIALNLVSNACKFSRPGGLVHVAAGREGNEIWLRVTDEGIGIAPQDVDKIFERFVQVESSANRRFEGTGIGLSIVKQLVTLHGGAITVHSEPSHGSTFQVRLPTAPWTGGSPAAALAPTPPDVPKLLLQPAIAVPVPPSVASGSRLLIVEDNTDLLSYLTQELGHYYRIAPFADSGKALRSALADPPDLIVADIMMPDLDGIALARELRGDPRTAEVPIVILSAREEVEAKLAGFHAGVDDYVQKPFDLQELRARIELHLGLRAQARELRVALAQLKRAESTLVQSEKMVALGRMVSGVAHEMNNPLHFLRGNLALLRRRVPADGPLAPIFADIDESLERMTSVTRQLLLFGRKQNDDGSACVKLDEVVPLAVKMLAPQTPKGARILQDIDGEQVRANPQDFFQIVLNIVHNALQAVAEETGQVSIAAVRSGDRIELRVADNGCGIAKENLPRIFDPFFTTKPPGSGTGLGLSIVQELVRAQNGTVRVESEQGRGTTVSVLLHAVST